MAVETAPAKMAYPYCFPQAIWQVYLKTGFSPPINKL